MPVSKIQSDNQIAGGTLNLGGDLTAFGFGPGHVGQVILKDATDGVVLTLDASGTSGTGNDKMLVLNGNAEILGKLDASGGQLRVPQGTTLPASGMEEGDVFWKSDTDELYIYNGTIWQLATATVSAMANFALNGSEVSTNSTGFVEVMKFQANLKTAFPFNNFKLQANTWVTGVATGDIRLYNFSDAAVVANAIISVSSGIPTLYESVSASVPIDALKVYTLDFRRVGGVPANIISIRGAMLRRV